MNRCYICLEPDTRQRPLQKHCDCRDPHGYLHCDCAFDWVWFSHHDRCPVCLEAIYIRPATRGVYLWSGAMLVLSLMMIYAWILFLRLLHPSWLDLSLAVTGTVFCFILSKEIGLMIHSSEYTVLRDWFREMYY